MENEQIQGVSSAARRFAQREVAAMVNAGSGGPRPIVESLLSQAAQVGLVANAHSTDHTIWGPASLAEGPATSLALLQEIAVECAGVASCLHTVALAGAELAATGEALLPGPGCVALFSPSWRPSWEAFSRPPAEAPHLARRGSRLELAGAVGVVDAPPTCGAFVVFARGEVGWERIVVPADAPGLAVESLGESCGLAAVNRVSLTFDAVRLSQREVLGPGDVHRFLRRYMLGLSAIALGNAVGALRAARAHAQERHQGGKPIEQHAAVQLLLGSSGARVSMCAAALADVARRDRDHPAATWRALAGKLQISQECLCVVSDCLQVFGAYGATEDCRLAKRLRDALTINTMALAPNVLRLLCATTPFGGQR